MPYAPAGAPTPHTTLPIPPSTADQANFDARADTFNLALNPFGAEMDTNGSTAYQNALSAYNNAVEVAGNAAAAAASASSALNAPGTSATSTSTLTFATGALSLTLAQTGKAFAVGQRVSIAQTSNPTSLMSGVITAFNAATGAMSVTIDYLPAGLSGSASAWTIALAGPQGAAGGSIGYSAKSGAYTVVAGDVGKLIDCTGSFTLSFSSAASLGTGFYCWVRSLTGTITGPTADGSTLLLGPGDWALVESDGSALHAVVDRFPGWVLDSSTAVSGSPTVINVALPTSGYSDVKIELDGLVPSASLPLMIAGSTNGGSSYGASSQIGSAGTLFTTTLQLIGYRHELTLISGSHSPSSAIASAGIGGSPVGLEMRNSGGLTNLQFALNGSGNFTNTGTVRVYKRR